MRIILIYLLEIPLLFLAFAACVFAALPGFFPWRTVCAAAGHFTGMYPLFIPWKNRAFY